ncbi:alpha/beta hydrolase [Streptomyces sp. NBC_01727]|uniref:alpha/beta fold hydrolase n=1 Tax=unclassified Streptomyces TaxID=2593676 RepID=UPI002E0F7755|nr:alpha/beta hydrolase [Streptomyces sp. NBC_01727]
MTRAIRSRAAGHGTHRTQRRVFSKLGAVRAGLEYYRHVLSPAGRKASAERTTRPLPMPVLTLGGEYADADNLFHTMRRFSTHVHNQVFAGIGHHLPEECPEEMFRAIERFWRDTPCRTAEPQGGRSGM